MAIVHDGNTNYATNGKANAALTTGIIGTSGFGLSLLNSLTNGMGLLGNNCAKAVPVCSEDHVINRYEAAQAAKIAELETEVKLRDANTYTDQKLLEVYKYFDGENKAIRADICDMKAQQGVVNANLMTGLDVLKSQVAGTQALVNGITRTAVPDSVICKFCNSCTSCCGNI
jgi:hypothetical protein